MNTARFDLLARSLVGAASRRGLMLRLPSGLLGLAIFRRPQAVAAKKNKKKLKKNEYGCVDVGNACAGKDANCCSGICEGKKPKQGKKDKSRCVAHNVGTCTPARNLCLTGDQEVSNCDVQSTFSYCTQTTGKASYCANLGAGGCTACKKDTDCEAAGFPPGSACVDFTGDGQLCQNARNICQAIGVSGNALCVLPGDS